MLENAKRGRIALPENGVEIATLDFGGRGPLALLHHANGFCAAVWAPVAIALTRHFRVIAMDARGHGLSSKPPPGEDAYQWGWFGRDAIGVADALCREHGASGIGLGLGHSFGGTALLTASAHRPALFERLALVDMIVPPRPGSELEIQRRGLGNPFAEGARKRRAVWPSREAAREKWAGKDLFADWDPRVFDLYLAEGLLNRSDGQVELACPPEIEAAIFDANSSLDVLELASRVRVPALVLWARAGNFPYSHFENLAAQMSAAELRVADAGHLVPMENPELVVREVLRFVGKAAKRPRSEP
jgi:pimeloyl-ACP methyl ester carboxylesterase